LETQTISSFTFNPLIFMHRLFYALLIIVAACQPQQQDKVQIEVTVHGKLREKLQLKMLYLEEQKSQALLDSMSLTDSVAYFNIPNSTVQPDAFLRVVYNDSINGQWYKRPIGFPNPYLPKTIFSSFLPEERHIVIHTYPLNQVAQGSFAAGPRNEPFLKQVYLRYPETDTPAARASIIEQNIRKIRSYQSPFFFARQLFNYRIEFTIAELQQQLAALGKEFKGSYLDSQFAQYFKAPYVLEKQVPPTLVLPAANGISTPLFQNKARFTLLIFWASWCGPCRKEIPALKKIAASYAPDLLSLCSISIDTETDKWKNAISGEQMAWPQLIARGEDRNLIDQYFLLPFIPKAYLIDSTGKVIRIFEGDSDAMESELEKVLH
jgi:thiol-disulfide isomerase/thioredoxin